MVTTSVRFKSVSKGSTHTCGLDEAGLAYCWGENLWGALGDSTPQTSSATPVKVYGGLHFQGLAAGSDATCGVTTGGRLFCWGRFDDGSGTRCTVPSGKVGAELAPCVIAPVAISADPRAGPNPTFRTVSVFGGAACAIDTGGVVYCWGVNVHGVLGVAIQEEYVALPYPVATSVRFDSVSTGGDRTCALTASGDVYCWGWVMGLEQSTRVQQTPAQLPGGIKFRAIDVTQFGCGVALSGLGYCWGDNPWGQLGDGSRSSTTSPVLVAGQPRH
jgi:alpha-tubulin suppressor-like RCC1 family protein